MREVLIANCTAIIWVIVALEAVLAVLLIASYARSRSAMTLCMLLIDLGLMVDALLINVGGMVPGGLPEGLSRVRFVCHGVLIPLMFPICGYALRAGKGAMRALWVVAAVVMVLGLAESLSIHLDQQQLGAVVRHVSGDTSPAWAEAVSSLLSFGTVIPLMIVGVVIWVRRRTPQLFLAGFLMFAFSVLGPATGNFDLIFVISMVGEVLMVLFFYLYARATDASPRSAA